MLTMAILQQIKPEKKLTQEKTIIEKICELGSAKDKRYITLEEFDCLKKDLLKK